MSLDKKVKSFVKHSNEERKYKKIPDSELPSGYLEYQKGYENLKYPYDIDDESFEESINLEPVNRDGLGTTDDDIEIKLYNKGYKALFSVDPFINLYYNKDTKKWLLVDTSKENKNKDTYKESNFNDLKNYLNKKFDQDISIFDPSIKFDDKNLREVRSKHENEWKRCFKYLKDQKALFNKCFK